MIKDNQIYLVYFVRFFIIFEIIIEIHIHLSKSSSSELKEPFLYFFLR